MQRANPTMRCDHDFSGWIDFRDGLGGGGGHQVCVKCGGARMILENIVIEHADGSIAPLKEIVVYDGQTMREAFEAAAAAYPPRTIIRTDVPSVT